MQRRTGSGTMRICFDLRGEHVSMNQALIRSVDISETAREPPHKGESEYQTKDNSKSFSNCGIRQILQFGL